MTKNEFAAQLERRIQTLESIEQPIEVIMVGGGGDFNTLASMELNALRKLRHYTYDYDLKFG